ncbi:MAG: response regulator [Thermodesulfobacteriota bacterium]|nr:response regulator [Thermodesulfobacteriota bacterium]
MRVTRQAFQILFDLKVVLFFLYDQEKNALIGKSAGSNNKFNFFDGVLIPFQEGKGLIVNSLRQGVPTDSFSYFKNDSPTIIDELVIRLTGRDGVMIFPMVVQEQYIGIIVVGLNETKVSHLRDNLKMLSMLSDQAAIALYADYLRQNQAKLVLAQRLKDTSTIARKVVHEVNTPLSIIKNYTKIMETKLAEKDIDFEELKIINEEINRVVRLLSGLYDFSKTKPQKINSLDINALLSEVVRIFKKSLLINTDIDIHLNLWHSLPLINTDKDKLKQVFINLIHNAVESILVVDDIKEQRDIADNLLSELGYSVTTLSSGQEAVEYMKDHSADLVILDMIMEPGLDGLETCREIIKSCPGQKAIIASGFSETGRVKEAQMLGVGQYIKKPYMLEKIGVAVKTELEK